MSDSIWLEPKPSSNRYSNVDPPNSSFILIPNIWTKIRKYQPTSEEIQQLNNDFEKPKKSVSIDDALVAAALAGFSSFTKPNDEFLVLPLESTSIPSESLKPTVTIDRI